MNENSPTMLMIGREGAAVPDPLNAELGHAPRDLDGRAAARFLWFERLSEVVAADRDQARANADRFQASDPERAAAELHTASRARRKLDSYQQELDKLRGNGADLDRWAADNEDALIRNGVYEREFEIRRQMDISQGVERSLVDPPAHLREQLGPPQRGEWAEIARKAETDRLARESAEREGLEPPERNPQAEQELAERIDRFRSEQRCAT